MRAFAALETMKPQGEVGCQRVWTEGLHMDCDEDVWVFGQNWPWERVCAGSNRDTSADSATNVVEMG
jgi:hypothetical protein